MRDALVRNEPNYPPDGACGLASTSRAAFSREDVRLVVPLHHRFERAARQANLMTQYWTLAQLADGPRRATEIASSAAVKKPTVSVMLAKLRNLGLTIEAPSPAGRATSVALSEAGRFLLSTFENGMVDHLCDVGEDDRFLLLAALDQGRRQNPDRRFAP
jgi:DNA-binding MarR family transcriptional regulator